MNSAIGSRRKHDGCPDRDAHERDGFRQPGGPRRNATMKAAADPAAHCHGFRGGTTQVRAAASAERD